MSAIRKLIFSVRNGVRILHKESHLNAYCAAIAGTVGHFLTQAAIDFYDIEERNAAALQELAPAFGRALHKIHIIKDFYDDQKRGICYFPYEWMQETAEYPLRLQGTSWRWNCKVVLSAWQDLKLAVNYISNLPPSSSNYRTFCLSAVVSSYYFIMYALQYQHKIFVRSRSSLPWLQKFKVMLDVKSLAADGQIFDRYFDAFDKKNQCMTHR
jgi:phytoene/squalene synthetase